ncbi:hypothetical protein ACQKOM_23305 [Peribacillus frigoritolerans]|uniref:hypothetical protein n=1 Tax=Peribacillus frigoritolerans TaxID=450367 RepID=UPI003D04F279
MERKVRDSCGKSVSREDPTGAKAPRRLPDRPRKASALRSNQRFLQTQLISSLSSEPIYKDRLFFL